MSETKKTCRKILTVRSPFHIPKVKAAGDGRWKVEMPKPRNKLHELLKWRQAFTLSEHQRLLDAQPDPDTKLLADQVLTVCHDVVTQYPYWAPAQKRRILRLVQLRFVEGWTLQRIGDDLFLSRERIRQLEAKVVHLVRKRLADEDGTETTRGENDDRIAAQA